MSHAGPATLIDILELRAEASPDLRVLTFFADGEAASASLTPAELANRARSIAAWLGQLGLAGSRVVLLFPQGLGFVAAYFGCAYAGAVAVPAPMPDPSRLARTLPRLRGMIADARPDAVLTDREGLALMAPLLAELPTTARALRWLCLEDAPAELASTWRRPALDGRQPAHLQYTSGSTSQPRGTIISHANIHANSRAIAVHKRYCTDSRSVTWVPHFHDDGLIHGLIQPLFTGYPCSLFPAGVFVARPERWLRMISRERGTHSGGPNFAYELCIRKVSDEQLDQLDLSTWSFAYNAAEPVRVATLRRFHERFAGRGFRWTSFAPCYGLAEATLTVSVGLRADGPRIVSLDAAALERIGAVRPVLEDTPGARTFVGNGAPVEGIELAIVDPHTGARCPVDRVGEILIKDCPSVASGYDGRDEESERTFRSPLEGGSYLRTGDQGFLLDGELFITGRLKDLIIVRGANRYPQDIEQSVERCHSAVAPGGVAAFSVEDDGEERLVVAAEIKGSATEARTREVLDAIREVIAQEHDLRVWAVVLLAPGSLPKTSSGKIQRRAAALAFTDGTLPVLERFADRTSVPAVSAPPPTTNRGAAAIEAFLVDYLATELAVRADEIGPEVPFSRHGLDSASSVRLAADLSAFVGAAVPPSAVWNYPCVRALSRHVAGEDSGPTPAPPTAPASGSVAIIGASCRLPGGVTDLESFWHLLIDGVDAIEEVPRERWDIDTYYDADPDVAGKMATRWGGFLRGIDHFDPAFFEISPREAVELDPQHRLLLELTWEALESAGQTLSALRGSSTGVFVGLSGHEYQNMGRARSGTLDPHLFLGTAHSTGIGRLSYWLGLHGPNMPVDTACSSSLVAVHLACQALRSGECTLAIAGGVNLTLTPESTSCISRMRALSPSGRCRTFSADADGYVRGEGCAVVVLKRLADAERDGDPILAVIAGSAVNQDGRSHGMTAPNGLAQAQVIRRALASASVEPTAIGFIETHGTGTPLGDPIEVDALRSVLGAPRVDGSRCILGAVKTNLGHLEAAAGVAGLLKSILVLRHGTIPKNLHFRELNPHLHLEGSALALANAPVPFPPGERPRFVGVSSFGLSGTNAHVIVTEAPRPAKAPEEHRGAVVLPLSGHSERALRERAEAWRRWLSARELNLADLAYTASLRRSHLEFRLAVVGASQQALAASLAAFAAGQAHGSAVTGRASATPPKVVFVFPGQGSQWIGMGRRLLRDESVFRAAIAACDAAIHQETGFSILDELERPEHDSRLADVAVVQPTLFAVEVALAALWRSWGVEPAVLVGHSMGEVAAAYVAGALTLADAAAVVCRRSRLLRDVRGRGAMALVELTVADAERALQGREALLSVAASNGPRATVIAGERAALEGVLGELEGRGVFVRRVNVDVASHSPQMDPLREPLREALAGVAPRAASIPIHSTVTGEAVRGEQLVGAYWIDNLREPVLFSTVIQGLIADGHTIFVELSPHPILLPAIDQNLIDAGAEGVALASMRRDRDERETLLATLAALHVRGVEIDWRRVEPAPGRVIPLPAYPWQRSRHWLDTSSHEPAIAGLAGIRQIDMQQHHQTIDHTLRALISQVTGLAAAGLDADTSLIRMGFDSLMVMQLKNALHARLRVDLPTTLLFDPATSLASIVQHVAAQVPVSDVPAAPSEPPIADVAGLPGHVGQLMAEQLRAFSELTRRQLEALQQLGPTRSLAGRPTPTPTPTPAPMRAIPVVPAMTSGVFVPYKPIQRQARAADTAVLTTLTREYNDRTAASKARTQADRLVFANNRNIAGLTPATKEMTYQIIAERASGSRIWDIDGNEYIDLTNGFGSSLFGHDAPDLAAAIREQMARTWAVGPISNEASEVARRICGLTGLERVAFYNSGTEAIMVALRLARTATGRSKVVMFEGSYHGMFDGVLAISRRGADGAAAPMAPGVPESMVEDTLVLGYDDPSALAVIAGRAHEIAAILVEPVQSRRPDIQPRGFLHALRELATREGIALIFDEVVTGFRVLPGGAQAWFGVQADLAAYGKVLGGGLPIGVVAGAARFMDGVDGGMWSFGDDSYPARTNTFVAGTFCSNPLSMACTGAVLERIVSEGPALQRRLNARTRGLCVRLSTLFADAGLPVHLVNFGSLFRFVMPRACEVLFTKLVTLGVYVWEGRNCTLTTAHSDADLDQLVAIVREAAEWLRRTVEVEAQPGFGLVEVPATYAQRGMYARCQRPDGGNGYHVLTALRVHGELRLDRLEAALSELVRRHPSLRTCFRREADALLQRIHPVGCFELVHERLTEPQIPEFVERLSAPFDLGSPGLVRCGAGELGPGDWVLVLDVHHLVVDGLSMERLVDELFALHADGAPPEPTGIYTDLVASERAYLDSPKFEQDADLWRALLTPPPPRLEFPADLPAEPRRSFAGEFARFRVGETQALRAFAREHTVTPQVLLNAVFRVFAWTVCGQSDVCFGGPTAGRTDPRLADVVGLFIGAAVYRARVTGERTFAAILEEARSQSMVVLDAQRYPFERISELLAAGEGSAPFEVGFSYEASHGRGVRQVGDLTVEPIPIEPRGISMDLVLECVDDGVALELRFAFNPRRFRRNTVDGWISRYTHLLAALLAAPRQPLGAVCDALATARVSAALPVHPKHDGCARAIEA